MMKIVFTSREDFKANLNTFIAYQVRDGISIQQAAVLRASITQAYEITEKAVEKVKAAGDVATPFGLAYETNADAPSEILTPKLNGVSMPVHFLKTVSTMANEQLRQKAGFVTRVLFLYECFLVRVEINQLKDEGVQE